MKVLHIFERMTIGGAETLILNVMQNQIDNSLKFDFLVHNSEEGEYDKLLNELGCKIISASIDQLGLYKYIHFIYSTFKKYDIIHCHVRKYALIDLPIAKLLNKTIILHCHSSSSKDRIYNNKMIKFLFKHYLNHFFDYAFTCSLEAKNFLFLSKRKTINITNGIDHTKFQFNLDKRNMIRSLHNIKDELLIGHVGSFREVKNQKIFLELAKELINKKVKFKICLIGDGELKKNIIDTITMENLNQYFIFPGNIFNVSEYLSAFDIFIFPSLYEGLPLSVIEAQINGLYVLCSNNVDKAVRISENFKWIDVDLSKNNINSIIKYILEFEYQHQDRNIKIREFDIKDTVLFLTYFYNNCI